jgi:hypothetical protein
LRAAVRRCGNSEAGFGQVARNAAQIKKEKQTMNGTVMQAILWIIAGFFLTLLIIRRSKRKAKNS